MNYTNLFSDHLVTALSSTLIHSLWQGLLLSVLTGLIMTCTRQSSSARRYNLLVAAMVLFAVSVAGTFICEYNKGEVHTPVSAGVYVVNQGPVVPKTTMHEVTPPPPIHETIGSYLNKYAAVIVWIWLLIVCARCVQLATGLLDVYYLRRRDIFSAGNHWEERVRQLCVQMGIKRRVGIIESARTKTPIVIGHLKPLILVPISMLASLSVEETEAILLHELAHIRRADYLVNLLQNLMEIVFFFNPAVLWLSALIKAERENCCDDIALTHSSKINYLKALVACEEYNQPQLAYAMALKGNRSGLKNRVTRIISNKNLSLNSREKSLLAACLVAAGVFTVAFANAEKINKLIVKASRTAKIHRVLPTQQVASPATEQHQQEVKAPTKPSSNSTVDTLTNDSLSRSHQSNAYSTVKYKAPQDTYKKVSTVYHQVTTVAKTSKTTLSTLSGLTAPQAKSAKTTLVVRTDKTQKFDNDAEDTRSIISDLLKDGIITTSTDLSFKIGNDEFIVNYKKQPENIHQKYRAKYVADQKNGDWDWFCNFDKDKYAATLTNNQDATESANKPVPANDSRTWEKYKKSTDDEHTQNLINDLLKDGIITTADNLSFKIGTDEFVVNYKKQPEAIYQKYRAKYVPEHKQGDWIWFYNFDTNKWTAMVANKQNAAENDNQTETKGVKTGVFNGKLK